MFYETQVKSHVRVSPSLFKTDTKKAISKELTKKFENFVSQELGLVIGVTEILGIREGIIVPGDGAAYYDTTYKILTFKPEMQEILLGHISDITEFGAFMDIGPIDGMIHVSQTMDDYVTFSKTNVLAGKETKKVLKVGDKCRARIVAVSYKDISNPKIGLTMRQPALGNLNWIKEELKQEKEAEKAKAKKAKKK